jgi:hypothetical protein
MSGWVSDKCESVCICLIVSVKTVHSKLRVLTSMKVTEY